MKHMVNGKWIAIISRFYPKCFTVLPHIQRFIHGRRCQPCKVTTNTSGAVRVRWCLAQAGMDYRTGLPGPGPGAHELRGPLSQNLCMKSLLLICISCLKYTGTDRRVSKQCGHYISYKHAPWRRRATLFHATVILRKISRVC